MTDYGFLRTIFEQQVGLSEKEAVTATENAINWLRLWQESPELDPVFAVCESPMERLFLMAFGMTGTPLIRTAVVGTSLEFKNKSTERIYRVVLQHEVWDYAAGGEEGPEVPIARADFLVAIGPYFYAGVIVEVDGHDFHEKTKEQAARDKSRDRAVLRVSRRPTVRFAGSEIHADPVGCVKEVIALLESIADHQSMIVEDAVREAETKLLEQMTAPSPKALPPHDPNGEASH
jgi:hypothetical protein